MAKPSPTQRLRTLNSLLTSINPSRAERAVEISKAVEFFIHEEVDENSQPLPFPHLAQRILDIHLQHSKDFGLKFWAIEDSEKEMLWLRSAFLEKLESIKHYSVVTLVVFGLQDTVVEDDKYWTKKVEERYQQIRDYLEQVAADWQSPGGKLSIIYI
ncbi:MAG: hypothetical protein MI748_01245 [Opitutales bacterium]|nr:hypothetical protein [Opitutales bacterium]